MLMKVGTESVRRQNRALVLATLRELGPTSHTDIAEWSGLSSATVTAITRDLVTEGVIEKSAARGATGRGRPQRLFSPRAESAYLAAVRITYDNVEYSLIDYRGTLKDRFNTPRLPDDTDVAAFGNRFREGLMQLVARSEIEARRLQIISITTKGYVAPGRATLLWSPVFGDGKIDFNALLPEWRGRIVLTNETRFAAQAAAAIARRAAPDDPQLRSATLSLDNSIGLGLASDQGRGQLAAQAPTFGHMVHHPEGPQCRCGAQGCIEAFAGFYGILRCALEVAPHIVPAKFIPLAEMDRIADQARRGAHMPVFAFRQAGEALGVGISRLFSLHGTMPVNVTGPGLRYFDLLRPGFDEGVARNLEVRLGGVPEIGVIEDESTLIFAGNVNAMLVHMDSNVIAQGLLE